MWSYINVITFLTLHTFSLTWFAAVVCTQRGKMPIHKTCGIKNPYPILLVTAILLITGEVLHAWLLQRDSINWHFGKLIPRGFSRIWPQFIYREVSIVALLALLWWLEVSNLLPDFSSQKRKRLYLDFLSLQSTGLKVVTLSGRGPEIGKKFFFVVVFSLRDMEKAKPVFGIFNFCPDIGFGFCCPCHARCFSWWFRK